jgi:TolB-like protein
MCPQGESGGTPLSHELGGGFEFKFLERVKQRNLFRVTAAYLGLAWFVIHVATVIGESFPRVHHFVPWLIYGLGVGLPIVLITSWLSKRTPRRAARSVRLDVILMGVMVLAVLALLADRWVLHRPTDETMLALLAVMVVVLLIDRLIGLRSPAAAASSATHTKGMPRVAILPFADMSPEKNQDYFCEGTAEEIIDALCAVTGLHVASRSASFQLKDRAVDAREVGRLLNVHAFLEGSVRKSDDRLRITAQLIDVGHGGHLWSQSFDRKVEDIFSVQEDIARHVVAAMRVKLLDADSSRLKRRGTRNAAAYELYLRGRQLLNKEKEAENRAAVLPRASELSSSRRTSRTPTSHAAMHC